MMDFKRYSHKIVVLFVLFISTNSYFHAANGAVEGIVQSTHVFQISKANNFKAMVMREASQNVPDTIFSQIPRRFEV